jgi:hypothetical protein
MKRSTPIYLILLLLISTPLLADAPSLAGGNGTIGVTWRSSMELMQAAVLSPGGIELMQVNGGNASATPAIAFDGTRYLAVWPAGGTLMGRLFDETSASGLFAIGSDAAAVMPAVSWNGAGFVVAWLRASGGYMLASVTPQGIVDRAAMINVSTGPLMIAPPVSLASSGSTTMMAFFWSDMMQAGIDAITVDAGLNPMSHVRLDSGSSVLYGSDAGPFVPQTPDVAANATEFFVTWLSSSGRPVPTTLRAARVGLDGMLIDGTPLTLEISPASETDANPRVTWDGRFFFETWTRTSGGPDGGTWVDLIDADARMSGALQLSRDPRQAGVTNIGFGRDVIAWVSDTSLNIAVTTGPPRRRAVR